MGWLLLRMGKNKEWGEGKEDSGEPRNIASQRGRTRSSFQVGK